MHLEMCIFGSAWNASKDMSVRNACQKDACVSVRDACRHVAARMKYKRNSMESSNRCVSKECFFKVCMCKRMVSVINESTDVFDRNASNL
jgi:hypothetical protein